MEKKNFLRILIFSVLVTVAMNAIDMIFHLFEGTAVHLNYVAVKLTVIFVSVFATAWWADIGRVEGIFTTILGPVMFYVYYKFASPTLNRALFKIDDQFWFVFVHAAALGFAYWAVWKMVMEKKYAVFWKSVVLALSVIALDFVYLMARVSLASGGNEEIIVTTLNPFYAGVLFVILVICFLLSSFVLKKRSWIAVGVVSAVLVYYFGVEKSLSHSLEMIFNIGLWTFLVWKVQKK